MEFLKHSIQSPNEHYIMHLRITPEDIRKVNDDLDISTPNPPIPFNRPSEQHTRVTGSSADGGEGDIDDDAISPMVKPVLTQEELHQPMFPSGCNIHCQWDGQPFDGPPVGVPYSYCPQAETFSSLGCFCSFECAAAHNMADSTANAGTRYTRHTLILLAHRKAGGDGKLQMAPDRRCLRIFGGKLTTKQFRSMDGKTSRIVSLPFRPYEVYQTNVPSPQDTTNMGAYTPHWTDKFQANSESTATTQETKRGLGKFMNVQYAAP